MEPLDSSRQYGLFRPEQALSPVTLIGAGGSGSVIATMLAKMGVPYVTVYDRDTVEAHNLRSTMFRREDVGGYKVGALADMACSFGDGQLLPKAEFFDQQPISGVVVSAVDDMDTVDGKSGRIDIWQRLRYNPSVEIYLDTRMAGLIGEIHIVRPCDPDDIARYEKYLYPSSEVAAEVCTERAIIFNTLRIASEVGAILRRWWVHGKLPQHGTIRFDLT